MKGNFIKKTDSYVWKNYYVSGICSLHRHSLVWHHNIKPIASDETAITEEFIPFLQENNTLEYSHDQFPETTHVDASALETDSAIEKVCTLRANETDAFIFGDAFQFYRKCLGADSTFRWKDGSYTTILAEDVIIQLADSMQVKEKTKDNKEISDLR